MPKQVILFLAANPAGSGEVNLARECAEIQDEIIRTRYREDFELKSRWAVSVDDVMRHLNECLPTVMHFSGHGSSQHGLIFEDARGAAQVVPPETLAEMIAAAGSNVRLVVLNACYADGQAQALSAIVECVVGMSGQVQDEDARAYAAGFYRALGYRRSIAAAHKQGIATVHGRRPEGTTRAALRDVDTPDHDKVSTFDAVLLPRPGRDPNRITLTPVEPPQRWLRLVVPVALLGVGIAGAHLAYGDLARTLIGIAAVAATFVVSAIIASRLSRTQSEQEATPALPKLIFHGCVSVAVAVSILVPTYLWSSWPFATVDPPPIAKVVDAGQITLSDTRERTVSPSLPVIPDAQTDVFDSATHPKRSPCWVTLDNLNDPQTDTPTCENCVPSDSNNARAKIDRHVSIDGHKPFDKCSTICLCQP